jgi:hypothetical protein
MKKYNNHAASHLSHEIAIFHFIKGLVMQNSPYRFPPSFIAVSAGPPAIYGVTPMLDAPLAQLTRKQVSIFRVKL